MAENNAVLDMSPGNERLIFLGPGGYKPEWSPGTKIIPLEKACSGHLMIPLTAYNKVGNYGVKQETPTMTTTLSTNATTKAPKTTKKTSQSD